MNQDITADNLNYDDGKKPKLPTGLHVLTILTFIGCAFWGILTILTPVINKFFLGFMDKALNSGEDLSAEKIAEIEKGKTVIELSQQNIVPLMTIGIIAIVLCFVGAIWMRKLKKDGYWMYVAGEIAPIIAGFFIMGTDQYTGIGSIIIGVCIPVLFVILYTMQRKHLVK